MHVCMYVYTYVVCMYVCMYVYTYVVCMYVWVCGSARTNYYTVVHQCMWY